MKIKKITINSIAWITMMFSMISVSEAHFGSKGPYGGSVSCMTVIDTMIYVGTYTGGVYENTNAQLITWRPRPVGLKSGNIHALSHTGSYLFAATDSGIYRFTGYDGNDRYWEKFNNGLPSNNVTSLLAIDSITLLAGIEGYGVYKTIDKGATWDSSNTNMLHYDVNGFVWAGNRIIQISDGGLWASDDSGHTWFDYTDISTDDIEATAISYNSTTDEALVYNTVGLYILATASITGAPAYVSAQANLPVNALVKSITNDGSAWYIATDQGVFSSPTGTLNWTSQNGSIPTMDIQAIAYLPSQATLVAGTSGEGIFKSPTSSIGWTLFNNGFNNLIAHSMVCSGTTLVVAATEKGVFVSKDLATNYTRANSGLSDSLNVYDIDLFGSVLVAGTMNNGIFISPDTGLTWTNFNGGVTNMNVKKVIASASYVYHVNSAGEIFQSDLINNWTLIQTGLPPGVQPTSMAFYNGNVLLGTMGDGVYTRPESSGNWTQINTGLTNLNVTSVTANDQNKIFAGTDGNGVFVSDNSTINWSATSALVIPFTTMIGLDGSKVQAMGFYAGYVYASSRGQVLATSDNGSTWIEGGTQFNLPSYADLNKLSYVTTRFFTTTPNNSLYSQGLSELPPLGINELDANSGIRIYPNPGNGNFRLLLDNTSEKVINVEIYDNTGKLVSEYRKNVELFSIKQAAGIFHLKITTNKRVINNKIVIE